MPLQNLDTQVVDRATSFPHRPRSEWTGDGVPPNLSVLIASTASGGGHVRAAEALLAACRAQGIPAIHHEVLQYTNPLFRRVYADYYTAAVRHCPEVLGWLYRVLDHPGRLQSARRTFDALQTRTFQQMVWAAHPSVILCTHFLPAEVLTRCQTAGKPAARIGLVVTDFDVHPLWVYPGVEWYFVATAEAAAHLHALGVPAASIHITGIPIDPVFAVPRNQRSARARLGLAPDRPTILVTAGGCGMGPLADLVQLLGRVSQPVQIVVLCGTDARLRRRLTDQRSRHPLTVIGPTNDMDGWMAAADLVVGKAGGLTTAEALARAVVPVFAGPLPGLEVRNSAILIQAGAAVRCPTLSAVPALVDGLLADPARLAQIRQAGARLARPHAAAAIMAILAAAVGQGCPDRSDGTYDTLWNRYFGEVETMLLRREG